MKKLETMKKIPLPIVADILGLSVQTLRLGLQRNELPIGFAVKTSSQYTYHISYEQLKNYVGVESLQNYENQKMTEMSGTQISQ